MAAWTAGYTDGTDITKASPTVAHHAWRDAKAALRELMEVWADDDDAAALAQLGFMPSSTSAMAVNQLFSRPVEENQPMFAPVLACDFTFRTFFLRYDADAAPVSDDYSVCSLCGSDEHDSEWHDGHEQ